MMMAPGFSVCESNYPIAAAVSPILHIHHPKTHTIGACSVHAIYWSTSFVVNFRRIYATHIVSSHSPDETGGTIIVGDEGEGNKQKEGLTPAEN